jgi:hypothetical protein
VDLHFLACSRSTKYGASLSVFYEASCSSSEAVRVEEEGKKVGRGRRVNVKAR